MEVFEEIVRRRIEEEKLFNNYLECLRKGEIVKACEFLWGSINNIAYCIGLLYGRKLGKHREIIGFMREIARHYGREELARYVSSAEAIHSNFFHNWMEKETFIEKAGEVEILRKWLIEILESEISKRRRKLQ
jgi:hypothetical protein